MSKFNYYGLGNIIRQYDFTNKAQNIESYVTYMLDRVQTMFEYSGLPDSIPKTILELYLMINGHAVILKHEEKLYVCFGSFSGEPNEYYIPQLYVVANPYLQLFETYKIDVDCVLIKNDSLMYGLLPMFSRYATQLVDNDITLHMVDVNTRVTMLLEATNDNAKASAERFLQSIEDGKNGVIAGNMMFDGIRTQPYSDVSNRQITELIELQQYVKASWYNEIGLQANYNMKREAINSNESQLNDDMIIPLIDDMLNCRIEFCERVNEMFGTNISVSLSSVWQENKEEREVMLDDTQENIETTVPTDDN